MAIPEQQLETWSNQGSIQQSQSTYETVSSVLKSTDATYPVQSCTVFLQGSYGNDTNIYADSDVDIVNCLNSVYYSDLESLSPDDKALCEKSLGGGKYTYDGFKKDVTKLLIDRYGVSVEVGKKAIKINGDGNRRDCDVLPAVNHKKFTHYKSNTVFDFHEGICFWDANGNKIVNYPKQHIQNCSSKNKYTSYRFKPTIRIFKNMRNKMISEELLQDGVAPSYYLEGMLYNVPNEKFSNNHEDTVANCINWLHGCNKSELICANERYFLLRNNSLVCWNQANFDTFLDTVINFWNNF